jgi:hypothetical protein
VCERAIVPQRSRLFAALCLLALSGSACLVATSYALAKHKSSTATKHKSSGAKDRHKSVAAKRSKKVKSSVADKEKEPVVIPQSRTPVDKYDCITLAQVFYVRAEALSKRTKQPISKEFEQVISKLDELCGEEEYEKARISIDWMGACLQSFTTDNKTELCSKNVSYFCAVDPQSDACLTREGRAD